MTREKDEYISLGERVNFAQKHNGDLFISIHLNSSPDSSSKTALGVEIFHWRDTGSDNAAVRYLEKLENDQLLPKLPKSQDVELKNILTSMLKDALEEEKTRSAHLCEVIWQVMSQNSYFKYHHRTPVVKSARFVVLANYAMPSILVEVGFLSNKEEASNLISDSFQWTTAKVLYNGIQAFFEQEDPDFKTHYIK
jgi:N-acetylmuramoyl-L-alanine amidase